MRALRSSSIVAGLIALLAGPISARAATTANLLVNGGAEQHRCTDDWTASTPVPGWHVLRGAASVLCYSAFAHAGANPVKPPLAGVALFAAPGADTAMEQSVDIGAAAAGVDRGAVSFSLSGWLGGWGDLPERATLTAIFLDADGHATGAPVVIADADAQARNHLTGLVPREQSGVVPTGTRRIVVTVHFLSGQASYHNAYADNISLTLRGEVGAVGPAPLAPPEARIPALDHVYVVMMENTNYADVVHTAGGRVSIDARMPFLASLASRGVILTNVWATYHPSDQNYVAMVAGDTYKYGPVYYPDYDLPVTHLGDLLEAKHKSWGAYVQNMRTPCNLTADSNGGWYAPDDQPFANFANVIANHDRCVAHLRDLTDFTAAVSKGGTPDFAWIAADGWWDGEGAWYENYDVAFSNSKQDAFLRRTFAPLLSSPEWSNSRSLLIITWDEADGWGWPDNHIPTILVGSPGLLRAGTVSHAHYDGYGMLRTIESGLGLPSLYRFDQFAEPLNAVFAGAGDAPHHGAGELWPAESVATRGGIAETFGRATVPAAVVQGHPIVLQAPADSDEEMAVSLEPLGHVPGAGSASVPVAATTGTVEIATDRLPPGVYGAWLHRRAGLPDRAPMMVTILSPSPVQADHPGVEIVGSDVVQGAGLTVRQGGNTIVRYCRPSDVAAADSWIGVFAAGTPASQMTKANANLIGNWLKTPGEQGGPCGQAEAYTAALTPNTGYEIILFRDASDGTATAIGRRASFTLTPALP